MPPLPRLIPYYAVYLLLYVQQGAAVYEIIKYYHLILGSRVFVKQAARLIGIEKRAVRRGYNGAEAAHEAGVQIPTLCFLEKREPLGACRVCLVEVEGARSLVASCSTPCTEGQVVHVNSPKARAARKQVVELLL